MPSYNTRGRRGDNPEATSRAFEDLKPGLMAYQLNLYRNNRRLLAALGRTMEDQYRMLCAQGLQSTGYQRAHSPKYNELLSVWHWAAIARYWGLAMADLIAYDLSGLTDLEARDFIAALPVHAGK